MGADSEAPNPPGKKCKSDDDCKDDKCANDGKCHRACIPHFSPCFDNLDLCCVGLTCKDSPLGGKACLEN